MAELVTYNNVEIDSASASTPVTIITATGAPVQINAITATNTLTSPIAGAYYILPSGTAAADVEPVAIHTVPASKSGIVADLLGQVVPANGTLVAYGGITSALWVTASGVRVES